MKIAVAAATILLFLCACFAPQPVLTDEDRLYIYESMNNAVAEGTMSQEEMDARIAYLEENTMSEEEYAIRSKDLILSPLTALLPDPLQQPTKDWTDDITKYIIWVLGGGTGVAGLGAGFASLKNSPEGKMFGPVRNNNKNASNIA
jgi:hypothetical protein